MSKLILSVDGAVVSRAKRYAKQQGISVSEMVEAYLAAASESRCGTVAAPPILRALRGSLKKADPQQYKRHLADKYR